MVMLVSLDVRGRQREDLVDPVYSLDIFPYKRFLGCYVRIKSLTVRREELVDHAFPLDTFP